MKLNKKLLTILLAVVSLVAVFAFQSAAKSEYEVIDHVVYQLIAEKNGVPAHYEVVSLFDSDDAMKGVKKITIPSKINNIPVTAISRGVSLCSYENAEVETIKLPNTMETIGNRAFFKLKSLKTINLPDSVKTIGRYAFSYCINLKKITIPKDVKILGVKSFAVCKRLEKVVFKGELEELYICVFLRCYALKQINLPESLKVIKGSVFSNSGLQSIRIPGGCALDDGAFQNANKLKKVIFEDRTNDSTDYIGNYAFLRCNNLLKVYLPKKTPAFKISDHAFSDCTKLQKVYRTENVDQIENHAFVRCESLEALTIPANIKHIGDYVFWGCTGLKKLRVLSTDSSFVPLVTSQNNQPFFACVPESCKIYVKTEEMKAAFVNSGFNGNVIVKADLA